MMDAVFYDGVSARRRDVTLTVTASSLDIHEGGEWIASWPVADVRRKDAPDGVVRVTREGGPDLARLDVTDPTDQAAIRLHCHRLDAPEHKERTGRIVFWSAATAVSIILCVLFLIPLLAQTLTPLVPVEYERRIGKAVDNQVRAIFRGKVCDAPEGTAALRVLTDRLSKAEGIEASLDVAVLESRIPNAIALPGGRIYIFQALLDQAESADELAGVLAHEIGHVVNRDGLRKLIQSSGTSYLFGLLFGDVTGGGAIVLASRYLVDSAYSRDAEAAADDFAGRTMVALARPAYPMALLLKRIEKDEDDEGGEGERNKRAIPAFLSTHPITDQRLKALEKQVPSQPGEPLLSQGQWRALKEICKTS
ncbi:M48 family metallopeptidase [Microvirga guangxiensis]|uniref:Peptidase family M48 n=1 Tax=Microvirga guangxiensis TaxID=549386 RepID=A0A1G5JRE0_9HYPH|nr:M48 family metallopeptidase [Microvirga guangxiensis]SCY90694.1 Peptidase family M48 [Microvirga guangxiensis]